MPTLQQCLAVYLAKEIILGLADFPDESLLVGLVRQVRLLHERVVGPACRQRRLQLALAQACGQQADPVQLFSKIYYYSNLLTMPINNIQTLLFHQP